MADYKRAIEGLIDTVINEVAPSNKERAGFNQIVHNGISEHADSKTILVDLVSALYNGLRYYNWPVKDVL